MKNSSSVCHRETNVRGYLPALTHAQGYLPAYKATCWRFSIRRETVARIV